MLILCALVTAHSETKANHAAGGELIYTHLGDSAYQFILKFYRDCDGPNAPATFDLCVYNTCTNTSFSIPLTRWQGKLTDGRDNGDPVSAGCSNSETSCEDANSSVPGYEEWWYTCVIPALPLKCNYWRFGVVVGNTSLCCRNGSTNLVGAPNFYIETTFNTTVFSKDANGNTVAPWENSSPYYSVAPVPYVCLNYPYSYNNGAIDPDGDSLWSQMINPLNTANCSSTQSLAPIRQNLTPPINFNTNPFPTNNTFSLNNTSGQMNFTAAQVGAGTMTIQTKEYRRDTNNVVRELGYIMRDVQVQVLKCNPIVPDLDLSSVDSGAISNGFVYGCVGQTLEFCFEVTSSDKDAVLLLSDNLKVAIPGATMSYTALGTDTVKACFKWTPTINDVGNKSFLVQIKDSTCRPPGILYQYVKTIDLRIWGPIETTADTSICNGESAFLGVTGGGNYEWTVVSGTDPSLSNRFVSNPVATPTTKTIYSVLSKANEYCPNLNKDTIEIDVLAGPEIANQPDDTTCPNYPVKMDIGLIKEPNATYTIIWTPNTGLNNATISDPTTTLKTTTEYTVEIASSANRCKTHDTILIDVLTGFTIENPDTMICEGESVEVRGTGDNRYAYLWTRTDQTAIISDPSEIGTTITPSKIGKNKYTLHAQYYKCIGVDSTAEFEIDLQPIPTAAINEDARLCYGDTLQLSTIVNPANYSSYSYKWTPGASLDFPEKANPIFSAVTTGINELQLIVNTPAGCSDTAKVSLNVFDAEFITVPDDTTVCPGDSVRLAMQVDNDVKFFWAPDYHISSINSMQPVVWPVTKQKYTVYGIDKLGCLDTAEVNIDVLPAAIIDIPDEIKLYRGESYVMDPGGNCLYYTWFPPLGLSNADVSNPAVSPEVNTKYVVHGRTEGGCSVKDSINILVEDDIVLELPNAFTPGSRNNNTLKLLKRGNVMLERFSIYNRWGTKVFETNNIDDGWDGRYNGEIQPLGVYVYTIEAVRPDGRRINKQGNVTLVR